MMSEFKRCIAVMLLLLLPACVAFGRVLTLNDKTYIIDLHGERWDVTQAMTLGFKPARFQHGIGRHAFTPLDDSSMQSGDRGVSGRTRVIGIASGRDARAYSVPKLWRHEIANSKIGDDPIAAGY